MHDFLALNEHDPEALLRLIRRTAQLKVHWDERRMPQCLSQRRVALINDDSGWRNMTAFDLGIKAMGGVCVPAPITLNGSESLEDLGRYLDNWLDAIVIRTQSLEALHDLATAATAPVINARTRTNHPCETLGDLSFIQQERHTLDGLKVAAFAPDGNILRSWVEASAVLPIEVIQIYPEPWHLRDPALLNARFRATADKDALLGADVVITDCWPKDAKAEALLRYQITAATLEGLSRHALFIPCPPVTRGQEVSADAMVSPRCRVTEAKAFLLHTQNAILEWALAAHS
jgi:ornithine carbamoyltransferase